MRVAALHLALGRADRESRRSRPSRWDCSISARVTSRCGISSGRCSARCASDSARCPSRSRGDVDQRPAAPRPVSSRDVVESSAAGSSGMRIRCHGDLHLGQIYAPVATSSSSTSRVSQPARSRSGGSSARRCATSPAWCAPSTTRPTPHSRACERGAWLRGRTRPCSSAGRCSGRAGWAPPSCARIGTMPRARACSAHA